MSKRGESVVERINETLAANSEDWKPRVAALQQLESIVDEALSADTEDAFHSLSLSLTTLSQSMIVQVSDLRSEVVRQCAHTLIAMSVKVPGPFAKCAAKLFPALLRAASGSNSVIRQHALPAAESLVTHVESLAVLQELLQEAKTTKNKASVKLCTELMLLALDHWHTKTIKKLASSVEEAILASLTAAEATTRTSAAHCALSFIEHFPTRSKSMLMATDQRALKLVNEARASHTPAKNVSAATGPGHKGRSDSVTSVESLSLSLLTMTDDADEFATPVVTRGASKSLSSLSHRPKDRVILHYGQRVEIVELLAGNDRDDSSNGVSVGRRGHVVSLGERQTRSGEWAGVKLEDATDSNDGAVKIVYVRPSTLRVMEAAAGCSSSTAQPRLSSRLRAPTIDTGLLSSSPSSVRSVSSSSSSMYTPPPSGATTASNATPNSARSLRRTPSSSSSIPASPSPSPLPPRAQSAATGRPYSANLPSTNATKLFSRSTQLPTSRIPVSQSRIQSRLPSRAPSQAGTRQHSRANSSGHGGLAAFATALNDVPAHSSLVSSHRSHVSHVVDHLSALNSALNANEAAASAEYNDRMIKLLSEHLAKTTDLLQKFVETKKAAISEQKRVAEIDQFLTAMDNFS